MREEDRGIERREEEGRGEDRGEELIEKRIYERRG